MNAALEEQLEDELRPIWTKRRGRDGPPSCGKLETSVRSPAFPQSRDASLPGRRFAHVADLRAARDDGRRRHAV